MKLVSAFAFLSFVALLAGCKSADAPDTSAEAAKPATSSVVTQKDTTAQSPATRTPPSATTTVPAVTTPTTTTPAAAPPAPAPATTKSAPNSPNPNNTQYSLVGTWNVTDFFKGTFDYKADGTMTFHFTDPQGTIWDGTGTYKLESGKLTDHTVTVHFTPGPKADAALRKSLEEANSKPPPTSDETMAIAWKDKDTILATGKDGKSVTTITRKK